MMRLIENLRNKVRLIVGRALIDVVNSQSGEDGLSVDISLAGGEKHTKVPLIQQYGLTSRPNKEAEAVVLFIGGARDNGIAIASQGKASKLPSLNDGEVALFSEYGQTIVLKKDGSIEMTPKSGKNVIVKSGMDIDGDVSIGGGMDVTSSIKCNDSITALTDVKAGIVSLTKHTHTYINAAGQTTPTSTPV